MAQTDVQCKDLEDACKELQIFEAGRMYEGLIRSKNIWLEKVFAKDKRPKTARKVESCEKTSYT